MRLFFALWQNNEEERNHREVITQANHIIKIDSHSIADKYKPVISSRTHYSKYVNGNLVAEEEEQMHISWYYRYEAELILEKFGYTHIQCQERFLNHTNHMTFIAHSGSNGGRLD